MRILSVGLSGFSMCSLVILCSAKKSRKCLVHNLMGFYEPLLPNLGETGFFVSKSEGIRDKTCWVIAMSNPKARFIGTQVLLSPFEVELSWQPQIVKTQEFFTFCNNYYLHIFLKYLSFKRCFLNFLHTKATGRQLCIYLEMRFIYFCH